MATIAGVDVGNVVTFPWVDKWALMCIDRASRDGHSKGVDEICQLLTQTERKKVIEAIRTMRATVLTKAIK